MLDKPDGESTAATPAAPEDDAAHIARLETLAKSADPLGVVFGAARPHTDADPAETEGTEPPAQPATPPATPAGRPAAAAAPKPQPEPSPQTPALPDPDTASPEELRAYARQHPKWREAMGLEVREGIQRRTADLQREQQARQQAEREAQEAQALAQQAQAQERASAELLPAYYDEEDPRHLDALRHFAEVGIQPVEIRQVLSSPVVRQHVRAVANEQAQQAAEYAAGAATRAAILAAAEHPALKALGADALEEVWQECDDTVADFYDRAFQRLGYLTPDAAKTYRQSAEAEARTRAFGDYPPAGSSVVTREHNGAAARLPSDPSKIDPTEYYTRAFTPRT